MDETELLRLYAGVLRGPVLPPELPAQVQQELFSKGAVAALEELLTSPGDAPDRHAAAELLRETAAYHLSESVREQAFRALLRAAQEGSTDAVDAVYRLAVEENMLAARQAISARGWQPGQPGLRALFDWFSLLEQPPSTYPESQLPLLTRAFLDEASPDLQRRLMATAAQNRAENWARIVRAIQVGTPDALTELVERYPSFSVGERCLALNELERLAGSGSQAAAETISLLFIRHEDERARDLALKGSYLPADTELRALFLFLADDRSAYEALDFDHSLLVSAYEAAGRSLRRRLLDHARHTGQTEWISETGAAGEVRWINDLSDADWELALRRLSEAEKHADLWRLAQVAPPIWSAAILDRLARREWQPQDEEERQAFRLLVHLAAESLARPLEVRPRKAFHAPAELTCLAIHPGGRQLAAGSTDQNIYIWDLPDGNPRAPLIGPAPTTRALAFSPDGEVIAAAAGDQRIRAFRMQGRQMLKTFEGHRAMIRALAVSPDGRTLYSASFDGQIRFWRFPYGPELSKLQPGPGELFGLSLSAGGQHLASAGADGRVFVLALPEGALARELPGHADTITHLAGSVNSELVASAGRDGAMRVWNVTSGGLVRSIHHNTNPLAALCLHPNEHVLIGGRLTGEMVLWSLSTGQEIDRLAGHRQAISGLVLSPEGDTLYSSATDGTVQVWDLRAFLTLRLPGDPRRPGTAGELLQRAKEASANSAEKRWLAFAAELARWRQRFDIELADASAIPVGEFDIEL